MTLLFRRRHNDAEASHDRARALVSAAFTEALAPRDLTWLEGHLSGCPECRAERDAYAADRALLRGLRDGLPEPPRDLWARTAAAIESEARSGRGRFAGLGRMLPAPGPRGLPLGILASTLVVLVVVGTALLPRGIPVRPLSSPGSSQPSTAAAPGATPFEPGADRVAWVQRAADGTYSLIFADIDHACHGSDPTCAPLADSSPAPLDLAAPPQAVLLSPGNNQIAVIGSDAETAGSVLIVDVPTPKPSAQPTPAGSPGASAPATPVPTPTVTASPHGSASPAPGGAHVLISGVIVVGGAGYSADGQWLAFSARPRGGPGGPDLYLWHVGDAKAHQVSDDGETYFSGWFGNIVLASGIVPQPVIDAATPGPTDSTASPTATTETPAASPTGAPAEAHPYSFLLDPATLVRTSFAVPDVWLPSIDPTGRFVTYWSGTVAPAGSTTEAPLAFGQVAAWRPAAGRLVLDGWTAPLAEEPSAPATIQPTPAQPGPTDAATADPAPASPTPSGGPAGTPIELAAAPIADFDAHFDPTGTRLAIWVLDSPDSSAGRLWLVVLDPVFGGPDPALQPMAAPGIQALHGFTIDTGRLAWASPAGQDGQPSSVQVLAWKGDDFGQVQSVPGGDPQLVR